MELVIFFRDSDAECDWGIYEFSLERVLVIYYIENLCIVLLNLHTLLLVLGVYTVFTVATAVFL